jgi:hypothetical protein
MRTSRRDFIKLAAGGALGGVLGGVIGTSLTSLICQERERFVVNWKWFRAPPVNFTTSSVKLVPSNLPVDPDFTKIRDDTFLWVILAVDIVPTAFNSCFNAIMLDDTSDRLQVSIAGPSNQLIVADMTDIFKGIPAGTHTFKHYVASNNGTPCTWRTSVATFKILEIAA